MKFFYDLKVLAMLANLSFRLNTWMMAGFIGLLLLSQQACGQEGGRDRRGREEMESVRTEVSPSLRNWRELARKFGSLEKIEESLEEIRHDDCQSFSDHSLDCLGGVQTVRFQDGQFAMASEASETILVAEGRVDKIAPIVRYRSRTKAFYEVQEGDIVPYQASVVLPKTLINIAARFSGPTFYPAHSLEVLSDPIQETFEGYYTPYTSHNTSIIEIIYEYNPQSPVVVLDGLGESDKLYDKAKICGSYDFAEKVTHIHHRTKKLADALKRIIAEHQIHFASLSFGVWQEAVSHQLQEMCSEFQISRSSLDTLSREILRSHKKIFDVLGKTPSLLTVQSAPYPGSRGPYDCNEEYANLFFVGGINDLQVELGVDGALIPSKSFYSTADEHRRKLLQKFQGVGQCADIYVNFHLDRNRDLPETLMASLGFGMGMGRIGRLISTSEAAPLGLTKLIYLRQTSEFRDRFFDDSLIQDLKNAATPALCPDLPDDRCVFQDPLKYRHTTIHAMNYW